VNVAPETLQAGKVAWILVKKSSPGVKVHFEVETGTECGKLDPADDSTNEQGEVHTVFTATDPPASCEATIKTMIARSKDLPANDPSNPVFTKKITVVPSSPVALATMDATTAITIILIASFAIDRFVTFLMLLLPLAKRKGDETPELLKKRQRVTYIALAGILGLLLGYFGDIRLLAGFGFSTNILLNAIVTALILTAGSDSISTLLKKISGSSLSDEDQKPLIVQGDLTLKRPERSRAATQEESGS
jgi:hypothetical protein